MTKTPRRLTAEEFAEFKSALADLCEKFNVGMHVDGEYSIETTSLHPDGTLRRESLAPPEDCAGEAEAVARETAEKERQHRAAMVLEAQGHATALGAVHAFYTENPQYGHPATWKEPPQQGSLWLQSRSGWDVSFSTYNGEPRIGADLLSYYAVLHPEGWPEESPGRVWGRLQRRIAESLAYQTPEFDALVRSTTKGDE